jgi:hypothetical protein
VFGIVMRNARPAQSRMRDEGWTDAARRLSATLSFHTGRKNSIRFFPPGKHVETEGGTGS